MCNQMWGIRCGQIIKDQCKLLWNKKSDTSIYTHNLYSQTRIYKRSLVFYNRLIDVFLFKQKQWSTTFDCDLKDSTQFITNL